MTVYLGNAWSDERGKSKGGESGNQNGKELRIVKWYKTDGKPWRVFRPKNLDVAEKLAYAMESACANKHIGYDQNKPDRTSLYDAAKPYGFDPKKVEVDCECDCSSLVQVCCAYAGIKLSTFSTSSEPDKLMKSKKFDEMIGDEFSYSPDYLLRGDILVKTGHTAIVLSNGSKALEDKKEDIKSEGFIFSRILKYGCKGEDVKELKRLLFLAGYSGLTLTNQNYKSKTVAVVKRYQKDHGLAVDGKAGPKTILSLGGNYI
jgi:hypothetical protein